MINSELLRKKIESSGYRFSWIAKKMNLSPYGLRKKINEETEFKVSEVTKICGLLGMNDEEREAIFFCKN